MIAAHVYRNELMATDTSSFNMRLPSALRERLGILADANDRSLNAEVVNRLAKSAAGGHSRDLFEALDMPRALRLRSTSTSADLNRLLTVCTELEADLIVLGARRDELNGAVLVAVVRTPTITCVMDQSSLSVARPPRAQEMKALFQKLDALELLQWAHAWAGFVDDTSQMKPAAAVDHLLSVTRSRLDLPAFLKLLGTGQDFNAEDFRRQPNSRQIEA